MKDHDVALPLAERIAAQTAAFLAACANNTGRPLTPSKAVDIGWHTFLLHTRDYADFCQRVAGHFIHHVPTNPAEGGRGAAAHPRCHRGHRVRGGRRPLARSDRLQPVPRGLLRQPQQRKGLT
ncbi:hypothetical protein GCM10022420_004140 [Streptomyces iranensis]